MKNKKKMFQLERKIIPELTTEFTIQNIKKGVE